MNHREIGVHVHPGSPGATDHALIDAYQPVHRELIGNPLYHFVFITEAIRPGDDTVQSIKRNLSIFGGNRCNLVCQNVCGTPWHNKIFTFIGFCFPGDNH